MRSLLALALLTGCVAPTVPARSETPAPTPDAPVLAMHRRLILVDGMREAVILADLEGAGEKSRKLARLEPIEGAPPEWGPWLARIRDAAARVDDTWTLDSASRTVADVGRTCGGCHGYLDAGPTFSGDGTPPVPKEGVRGHMTHHKAAVDGMWEGLITADTLRFARAAKALSDTRIRDEAVGPQEQRLHDLAARAAKARSLASRADVFGSVLSACADCHQARDSAE